MVKWIHLLHRYVFESFFFLALKTSSSPCLSTKSIARIKKEKKVKNIEVSALRLTPWFPCGALRSISFTVFFLFVCFVWLARRTSPKRRDYSQSGDLINQWFRNHWCIMDAMVSKRSRQINNRKVQNKVQSWDNFKTIHLIILRRVMHGDHKIYIQNGYNYDFYRLPTRATIQCP